MVKNLLCCEDLTFWLFFQITLTFKPLRNGRVQCYSKCTDIIQEIRILLHSSIKLFSCCSFAKLCCDLTLYHTILTFKKRLWKTWWKKEKMLVASIFCFPTMFTTLSCREIINLVTFKVVLSKCFQFAEAQNICHVVKS